MKQNKVSTGAVGIRGNEDGILEEENKQKGKCG